MPTNSQVYFVQGPPDSPIKIGISINPEERLRTFQTASPHRLRILRLEPGGRSRELALHRRFRRHRLEGEWFQPVPELLDYIAHAPAGRRPRRARRQVPWGTIGRRTASPAIGVWRILTALLALLARPRRLPKRHRRTLTIATPTAVLGAAGAWQLPDWQWWIIATLGAVAATIIGWRR